jgi:flagellar basal body-associated protein FliL
MEKSSLMMGVIILLLVALLGTIVGVTIFAFSVIRNFDATAQQPLDGFDRTPRQLLPGEIGRVTMGDPILTNAANENGGVGRVVRIQFSVGFDNTQGSDSTEIETMLDDHMDYIRSMALASIRNRTLSELSDRDGMRLLGDEILETLQNDFRTNMIVAIYFNEWALP